MGFTDTRAISRRDAAVAAALSGAVLVVLGYASGWGLDLPTASAANATVVQPTETAPEVTQREMPPVPTPVQLPAPAPASVTTLAPVVRTTPAAPTTPQPTPRPTDEPGETCDAGLLTSLGLDLPLTDLVKPLLSSVTDLLGGDSLLNGLTSTSSSTKTAGSIGELIDKLLGSGCSAEVVALAKDSR